MASERDRLKESIEQLQLRNQQLLEEMQSMSATQVSELQRRHGYLAYTQVLTSVFCRLQYDRCDSVRTLWVKQKTLKKIYYFLGWRNWRRCTWWSEPSRSEPKTAAPHEGARATTAPPDARLNRRGRWWYQNGRSGKGRSRQVAVWCSTNGCRQCNHCTTGVNLHPF